MSPAVVDEALAAGRASASVASLTLTVVAAAITSPTRPVTAAVASRSAARYALIRPSSAVVVEHDADQREQQHGGADGVGGAEQEPGGDGEHEPAGHVDHAVDEHGDVLGVVAEVGERLAGRADRLAGLRAAAGHLRRQQVGAQQRLHVHPRLRPHDRAEVDRAPSAPSRRRRRASAAPVDGGGVAVRQRLEAAGRAGSR